MLSRRVRAHPAVHHGGAILAYLALSLIVTWPLLLQFGRGVLGEDAPDRDQNLWNLWWTRVALVDLHTNPFHTGLLFYPAGADLYFHTLDLPLTLTMLGPQLVFGVGVAYNLGVILALVLAGYAGWRLVCFLTGGWGAAWIGGSIIGFNTLALISTRSQINLVSSGPFLLCVEFYLRTWERGRARDGILTGLFFALALLTVGYYEVDLLILFAVHLVWLALTWRGPGSRLAGLARRGRPVLGWAGGTTLLLVGPYLWGALASVGSGALAPSSPLDTARSQINSADLLSFALPYREGRLLGAAAPWWAAIDPAIHDHVYLGLAGLALAGLGIWVARRRAITWLWVAVGVIGLLLALGPILQIDGQATIPMPFALLQDMPPFSLVRFPERFVVLAYLALGVLAAGGVRALLIRQVFRRRALIVAGLALLLVLDMPLYSRTVTPLAFPATVDALAHAPAPGPVLELPFSKHDWPDAIRMFYQIDHGRATTSGYLSRTIPDPYAQACAPFHAFVRYRPAEAQDVVTPSVEAQLPALIAANGIAYVLVYKARPATSTRLDPLPAWELADLQGVAGRAGTAVADDGTATLYQVRPAPAPGLFLQLGTGWYDLEASNGAPFRWMDGTQADLCVSSPAAHSAPLTFQVISFGAPRHLQVWAGDRQVLEALVPAGWVPQTLATPPLAWPAGPQPVRLVTTAAPISPAALGQGSDPRLLGLGFYRIALGP